MAAQRFIAFDMGAESGRAVAGLLDGEKLELDILHRFPNGPVRVVDHLFWDVLGLFRELQTGIKAYVAKYGDEVAGLGLDTWGVDFGLLDRNGMLLGNPYHYRDHRTDGMPEKLFKVAPRGEVYEQTGIQVMQLNTLFQFYSMVQEDHPLLDDAETMLFVPDLLNYFFTGEKVSEYTVASTSQMYGMADNEWAGALLEKVGIPTRLMPQVVAPASVVGTLMDPIAVECGLKPAPVIAPACHDTAAAVAAVPAEGEDWCYLSSGTWSLMGVELSEPVITSRSRELNFTNEGGVDGTIRFLKNIMGLWIVQELRREWLRAGDEISYAEMVNLAQDAEPFRSLVDPDHAPFLKPGDMPAKMAAFCATSGQHVPETKGQFVRTALESLALTYRWVVESLTEVTGKEIAVIHIVGGGCQNQLLNRFTADASGRLVVTGPVEATAIGNVLMQAVALGAVGSLADARAIVRNSFEVETVTPGNQAPWNDQQERFAKLCGR